MGGQDKTKQNGAKHSMLRFLKKYWWLILLGLVILGLLAVILYQFYYASLGQTLPNAHYGNQPVGHKLKNDITLLDQENFKNSKIKLMVGDQVQEIDTISLASEFREGVSFSELSHYSTLAKLTPFSLWLMEPRVDSLEIKFDREHLKQFADKFSQKHLVEPTSAEIKLENGAVQVKPEKPGSKILPDEVVKKLNQSKIDLNSDKVFVRLQPQKIEPKIKQADFAAVSARASSIINKNITVQVDGLANEFVPTKNELAEMLEIYKNEAGQLDLKIKPGGVEAFSDKIDRTVAKPAGKTIIQYEDGVEKNRTVGPSGQKINRQSVSQELEQALFSEAPYSVVSVAVETVAPQVEGQTIFSSSGAGLQAKINEIGRRYNVRIYLKQLTGARWAAGWRQNEQTPSASTYKLYVAIRLLDDIEHGRVHWSDPMRGMTVDGCFREMIIVSANGCAMEWLDKYGRQNLDNYIHERGISGATTFVSNGATKTSPEDLVRVLEGIYNGSLAQGGTRQKLLDSLAHQQWREGIPKGTTGWTSDKVGFWSGYVHDAGIVHHPKGEYIMAVMTYGHNYATIAQITKEVEAVMYP